MLAIVLAESLPRTATTDKSMCRRLGFGVDRRANRQLVDLVDDLGQQLGLGLDDLLASREVLVAFVSLARQARLDAFTQLIDEQRAVQIGNVLHVDAGRQVVRLVETGQRFQRIGRQLLERFGRLRDEGPTARFLDEYLLPEDVQLECAVAGVGRLADQTGKRLEQLLEIRNRNQQQGLKLLTVGRQRDGHRGFLSSPLRP